MKRFTSTVDPHTHEPRYFSFSRVSWLQSNVGCNYACLSNASKQLLYSSISQIELETLEMEGVEIPKDLEYVLILT